VKILVAGGAGFIGHHLARYLRSQGHWVRIADKNTQYVHNGALDYFDHQMTVDLTTKMGCNFATNGIDQVYDLASNMGGMGYIANNGAVIMRDNTLMNTSLLDASHKSGVQRYLYASSACVYAELHQNSTNAINLSECMTFPGFPDTGYGWQKLFHEQVCAHYTKELKFDTRIARLHAIYGPECTWNNGREKVIAALCRKIATAKYQKRSYIEIWGDGNQTRSFLYVQDCIDALVRIMSHDQSYPYNVGSDYCVSVNQLAQIVSYVADYPVELRYVDGPQGVRGRSADYSLLQRDTGWEPITPLEIGISTTYDWIEKQVRYSSMVTFNA
jgi:GDP-D-mannose 3',5'-epimerase